MANLQSKEATTLQAAPEGGGRGTMSVKAVVVGSPNVGKSCFILRFVTDNFEEGASIPVDNYFKVVDMNGRGLTIGLWDTPSSPDYARLRPLSYPPTDIFVLFFSLVDPASLWDIEDIWFPEISHHCPNTPFILVGTKSDLRETIPEYSRVSTGQGTAIAMRIGALAYIETSTKENYNIELVFHHLALVVLNGYRTTAKPKRCSTQ